jgi:hypothetical protein
MSEQMLQEKNYIIDLYRKQITYSTMQNIPTYPSDTKGITYSSTELKQSLNVCD